MQNVVLRRIESDGQCGLCGFFKLGAFAPDNSTIAFGKQTPVGRYPVTETGITEANLPVLKNYIVSVYDGQLEIEPREVVVTASDGDWYVEDEGVPEVHATFEVQNDDRERKAGCPSESESRTSHSPAEAGCGGGRVGDGCAAAVYARKSKRDRVHRRYCGD